jgi:hypothetical protein
MRLSLTFAVPKLIRPPPTKPEELPEKVLPSTVAVPVLSRPPPKKAVLPVTVLPPTVAVLLICTTIGRAAFDLSSAGCWFISV